MSNCIHDETGERIVLVPYLTEHVPIYHAWMKDTFLQGESEDMVVDAHERAELIRSLTTQFQWCHS